MRYTTYRPMANRGEFHVRDEHTRGPDHQPLSVCVCWTQDEAAKIAAALNDVPKAAPLVAYALSVIEWMAVEGAGPLSPSSLIGDDGETFQEAARRLIAPQLTRVTGKVGA